MPKESSEVVASCREEIINACEKLYGKGIGIAARVICTSMYNYFETKEEIFLTLLKQEYEL